MSRELPFFSWEVAHILYGRMEIPSPASLNFRAVELHVKHSRVLCNPREAMPAVSWRWSRASPRGQTQLQGLCERSERWGGAQWLLERPHRQTPLPGRSFPFEILPLGFTLSLPIFSYLLDQCQLLLVFVFASGKSLQSTGASPQCPRGVTPKGTEKKHFLFCIF